MLFRFSLLYVSNVVRVACVTFDKKYRRMCLSDNRCNIMCSVLCEQEKCNQYWPEEGEVKSWGNFITEASTEDRFADYVIREFSLKNEV